MNITLQALNQASMCVYVLPYLYYHTQLSQGSIVLITLYKNVTSYCCTVTKGITLKTKCSSDYSLTILNISSVCLKVHLLCNIKQKEKLIYVKKATFEEPETIIILRNYRKKMKITSKNIYICLWNNQWKTLPLGFVSYQEEYAEVTIIIKFK